ncbi:hypothetical protein Q4E93_21830 [Flavitalea sp. BT771]|uniref:imm11 family protein n=1 Tax=Flavitalea sp. BT771 TaxID=3063329 RepID=UPI0026E47571|nr:DUF1629 domain-containing protein [Flavitalea sp. BT771]MDO6433266.1 hypothetical protein [Flavitalea sp. BT771]MDV6222829.1 hypothetical protein [Flavitalea sp. BT771]
MSYYIIEPACNTIETGSQYPQVQEMGPDYDYKAGNSVYALSRCVYNFPDFVPNLDYFVVKGKAKLTDLLSVAPINGGLLISSRFKELLENFSLVSHRFYPSKVSYKRTFYEYYWMHIISNLTDLVDYPASTFFTYFNYTHNLGYTAVSSKEDYLFQKSEIKKNNPGKSITLWAEKIKLSDHFDKSLDLFEISSFDSNFYISEQLKAAIISINLTGCNIKPATNLLV